MRDWQLQSDYKKWDASSRKMYIHIPSVNNNRVVEPGARYYYRILGKHQSDNPDGTLSNEVSILCGGTAKIKTPNNSWAGPARVYLKDKGVWIPVKGSYVKDGTWHLTKE